ncbi:hypothetical protein C8Q75DRAFT_811467 [Abortiporus biennis]|nr:hypothetical protein C8Q75DRAFT_811467 [Abortiporus biennis]
MFTNITSKGFFIVSILFSTALVAVQAIPHDTTPPPTSCSTGTQECCNQVTDSHNQAAQKAASLVGVHLGSITGLVGLGCTPVLSNAGCHATAACCQDNSHGNIISLGCAKL